jgi:hypothetical protein
MLNAVVPVAALWGQGIWRSKTIAGVCRIDRIATAILTMSASSDTKTLNFWFSRLALGLRSRVRSGPHDCRLPASPVRFPDPDGQGHMSRLPRLRR